MPEIDAAVYSPVFTLPTVGGRGRLWNPKLTRLTTNRIIISIYMAMGDLYVVNKTIFGIISTIDSFSVTPN